MPINQYGLSWPDGTDPANIERYMIRAGGKWVDKVSGKTIGLGLFHHYKTLQTLLWPEEEDHHRWSDLMLSEILANRITAISGARDSGKTHVALSRFSLTDYWCFPDETLILISSTDLRGLQLRVWGDIKDLLVKAKELRPLLPGNVVESLHGVFTDKLSEDTPVRDIRKGIICIPCLDRKGTWVGGLEKFVGIKQKRRRLLGDECFVAGTLVDTPLGPRAIETISAGDAVFCASGIGIVKATGNRRASNLLTVKTTDGRKVQCTREHEFFTQKGWVSACELTESHYIVSAYETMRLLQNAAPTKAENVLQQYLFSELSTNASMEKEISSRASRCSFSKSRLGQKDVSSHERKESYALCGYSGKSVGCPSGDWMEASSSWRQWNRTNQSRRAVTYPVSGIGVELWDKNRLLEWERLSSHIQSRRSLSKLEDSHRSRWPVPRITKKKSKRREENKIFRGSWVERVEGNKQSNSESKERERTFSTPSSLGRKVFNLEVVGHPSYSVSGLLVHNCQFMHAEYLTVLSNLDKGDFKGVFVGNALANMRALDKISEPVEGWGNHADPTKTEIFPNRYGGKTITLVGTDSPNYDYPETEPDHFPYLVSRSDEKSVGDRYGRTSEQYYSQIAGYRKPGLFSHRVLTQEICERCRAFDEIVWHGEPTTKIYATDMGFGGDRCVTGWGEFGKEVGGAIVMCVHQPSIIPISVDTDAEDQIALYVKKDCDALSIPGRNAFYDAGMKATAAVAMSKIFDRDCEAVNFGGSPTKRPVSADEYVFDPIARIRRLKRCDEHYIKFVTEMWFSVRLTVLAKQMRQLPKEVAEEFYLREWTLEKGNRYELETKQDTKARTGVSPDYGDWLAILTEGARRRGFMISQLDKPIDEDINHDWKRQLQERAKKLWQSRQLEYANA